MVLGLSTRQALVKLRDQLSALVDQHQRATQQRATAVVHTHNQRKTIFYGTCLLYSL